MVEGGELDGASQELLESLAARIAAADTAYDRVAVFVEFGENLAGRYFSSADGDPVERDAAIDCFAKAVAQAEEAGRSDDLVLEHHVALVGYVDLLIAHVADGGQTGDLEQAIAVCAEVLGVAGGPEGWPRYQLGILHALRYEGDGQRRADLELAGHHLRLAAKADDLDDAVRVDVAVTFARALAERGRVEGAAVGEHLGEAIEQLAVARRLLLANDSPARDVLAVVRTQWALMHALRFMYTGSGDEDIELAVTELTAVIAEYPDDDALVSYCRALVAQVELCRMLPAELRVGRAGLGRVRDVLSSGIELGSVEHARAALRHLDAIAEVPPGAEGIVAVGKAIALVEAERGQLTADTVDEAISFLDDGSGHLSDHDPELRAFRAALSAVRAGQQGEPEQIDAAVDAIAEAATLFDESHPMRDMLASVLAIAARVPDLMTEPAEDQVAVVGRLERALRQVPDDHPARPRIMTKLGFALLRGMWTDRSSTSMETVLGLLRGAVARKTGDRTNDAVNSFLLGIVTGLQGAMDHDVDIVDEAIRHISAATETMVHDDRFQSIAAACLGITLFLRYKVGSELEFVEAAHLFGQQVAGESSDDPTIAGIKLFLSALTRLAQVRFQLNGAAIDESLADLERVRELIPTRHPLRSNADGLLGMLRALRSAEGEGGVDLATARGNLTAFRAGVSDVAKAFAGSHRDGLEFPADGTATGLAHIGEAYIAGDQRKFAEGLWLLGEVAATPGLNPYERLSVLTSLGLGFRMRYELFRRRQDLDRAIDRLDEARRVLWHEGVDFEAAFVLNCLADCLHTRGDNALRDRERAVVIGLDSLRERARTVRLQSGARRALETATAADGEAVSVARWCLAASRPEAAVRALELGRAMVLQMSTSDSGVPALLRERGAEDLAREWDASVHEGSDSGQMTDPLMPFPSFAPSKMVPSDLRRRVLDMIDGHGVSAEPPDLTEIASSLDAGDVAALVYLLPKNDDGPGTALVVDRAGQVSEVRLPGLGASDELIDEFDEAVRGADPERRQEVLGRLCDWAWTAVMRELVGDVGGPARLVLVPVGRLAVVPWHSARRVVAGGALRYACQDAVISYAASARQFVQAARGSRRAWDSAPGIVRVGDSKLYWASREIEHIRARHYPDATYFGGRNRGAARVSQPATPDNVRTLLPGRGSPGVSVLHLGAHAHLAVPQVDSYLALTGGRLHMRDMLAQARQRPSDAVGGLVVLASCVSDHGGREHDEVLTLATAFLAAGAVGVVGARWEVSDIPTAIFMIMFHHYLNSGYADPATALRATQRWMLDPHRRLPVGVDERLAHELSLLDLAAADMWAAFTYQGR